MDIREVVSQLTDLWLELLPVDEVMQDDDFFNLGGDSILALQLTNRIRDLFQVELQITDVFTTPRVPGLAACILEKHQRPAQVARLASTVERRVAGPAVGPRKEIGPPPDRPLSFSIYFFSADGSATTSNKYDLFRECTQFADR